MPSLGVSSLDFGPPRRRGGLLFGYPRGAADTAEGTAAGVCQIVEKGRANDPRSALLSAALSKLAGTSYQSGPRRPGANDLV
jgi:hypothetical protein